MEFIVFPDHPGSVGLAARTPGDHDRTVHHPSGRPWIVGSWTDDEIVIARAGQKQMALLGRTTTSADSLVGRLERARSRWDLDEVAAATPGCVHAICTVDGTVRAQGTLAGAYRIYYAEVEGLPLAADRPDLLARWSAASIDERRLSLFLLTPYSRPPWPMSEQPVWRGIHKVSPGHYLEIDSSGRSRTVRWWSPPAPTLSRSEAAELVRERMMESVASRTPGTGQLRLSSDLSGGMDSTSLCYVAQEVGEPFITMHYQASDPSNQDAQWSQRIQKDLTNASHVVLPPGSLPGAYAESMSDPPPARVEGPLSQVHPTSIATMASLLAQAGSGRHMRGDGSDELFRRSLNATAALVRRQPLKRWNQVLRLRARNRWTVSATVRNMSHPGSYRRWLARTASQLTAPHNWETRTGWDLNLRMPRWATADAVNAVRELYQEAIDDDPRPVVDDPGQFEMLRLVQLTGELIRQASHISRQYGLTYEGPYVDDRLINAAMSVRFEERSLTGVNKPVLAAAMRGIVPDEVLSRNDKSTGNRDMHNSLRRNRPRLAEMCEDSLLTRMGLVDGADLRSVALGLHKDLKPIVQLGPTWATELWLRGLSMNRSHRVGTPAVQNV